MNTHDQWAAFNAAGTILLAVAWQNFWGVMLPPGAGPHAMASVGWLVAFGVCARELARWEGWRESES